MAINNTKIERVAYGLIGLGTILLMYPYFTWGRTFIFTAAAYVFLLCGLSIQLFITKKLLISPALLLFILYIIYTASVGFNYPGTILDSVVTSSILFLLFISRYKYGAFVVFAKFLSFVCVLSISAYLLRLVGVLNVSAEAIAPDGRMYKTYFANTLQTQEMLTPTFLSTGLHRFYSVLNEPGFIGTIASLIICAFRFQFKKYKFLIPLLISAIMSFSLAAYLTTLVYFICNVKPVKLFKYGLPTILLISFLFSEIFQTRIIERIQSIELGTSNDDRTSESFNEVYDRFLLSNDIWLGMGKDAHSNIAASGGVSSWKSILYNFGVFGVLIYLCIVFSIFFEQKEFSKASMLLLGVFLLTIYHRPNIHYIYYLVILYGGLIHNKYERENNNSLVSSCLSVK